MGIGIGSLLSAGASILGGLMSSDASSSAAQTQAQSGQAAIAEQQREFDIGQTALAPYKQVGQAGLYKLSDYLGLSPGAGGSFSPGGAIPAPATANTGSLLKPFSFDITQDPGYQFRLGQGETAIRNAATATGGISGSGDLSGATLKELLKYGSDYASGEYNAAFNRDMATKNQTYSMLSGVAGMGQGATTTGVQAGNTTAGNIANTITGVGNATASGIVGSSNALTAGFNNAASGINQQMLLKQIMQNQNQGVQAVNSGVNLGSGGSGDFSLSTIG